MEVRTIRRVTRGEELNVRYADCYAPRSVRRAGLRTARSFDCKCRRCDAHEFEYMICGISCPVSSCQGYVACDTHTASRSATAKCSACDRLPRIEELRKGRALVERLVGACDLERAGGTSNRDLEGALQAATGRLHPNHHAVMRGHRLLMCAALKQVACNPDARAGARQKAIRHAVLLADCLQSPVCPQFSVEAASVQLRLGDLYAQAAHQCRPANSNIDIGQLDLAVRAYGAAIRHQRVCLGANHHLTSAAMQRRQRAEVSIRSRSQRTAMERVRYY